MTSVPPPRAAPVDGYSDKITSPVRMSVTRTYQTSLYLPLSVTRNRTDSHDNPDCIALKHGQDLYLKW
jgi:hypothetical protein